MQYLPWYVTAQTELISKYIFFDNFLFEKAAVFHRSLHYSKEKQKAKILFTSRVSSLEDFDQFGSGEADSEIVWDTDLSVGDVGSVFRVRRPPPSPPSPTTPTTPSLTSPSQVIHLTWSPGVKSKQTLADDNRSVSVITRLSSVLKSMNNIHDHDNGYHYNWNISSMMITNVFQFENPWPAMEPGSV